MPQSRKQDGVTLPPPAPHQGRRRWDVGRTELASTAGRSYCPVQAWQCSGDIRTRAWLGLGYRALKEKWEKIKEKWTCSAALMRPALPAQAAGYPASATVSWELGEEGPGSVSVLHCVLGDSCFSCQRAPFPSSAPYSSASSKINLASLPRKPLRLAGVALAVF